MEENPRDVKKPPLKACDACNKKKTKCDGVLPECGSCSRSRSDVCTYERLPKKPGPPPGFLRVLESRLQNVEAFLHPTEQQYRKAADSPATGDQDFSHPAFSEFPPAALRSLLDEYLSHIDPGLPIIHIASITTKLSQTSPLLLNAMFAHAAQFSEHPLVRRLCKSAGNVCAPNSSTASPTPAPCVRQGDHFYLAAKCLLFLETETPSLAVVQALILMAMYCYTSGRGSAAWNFVGLAIRLGQDVKRTIYGFESPASLEIALQEHRGSTLPHGLSHVERECFKRIWWTNFLLDRTTSIIFEQSFMMDEKDCDVPLPSSEANWRREAPLHSDSDITPHVGPTISPEAVAQSSHLQFVFMSSHLYTPGIAGLTTLGHVILLTKIIGQVHSFAYAAAKAKAFGLGSPLQSRLSPESQADVGLGGLAGQSEAFSHLAENHDKACRSNPPNRLFVPWQPQAKSKRKHESFHSPLPPCHGVPAPLLTPECCPEGSLSAYETYFWSQYRMLHASLQDFFSALPLSTRQVPAEYSGDPLQGPSYEAAYLNILFYTAVIMLDVPILSQSSNYRAAARHSSGVAADNIAVIVACVATTNPGLSYMSPFVHVCVLHAGFVHVLRTLSTNLASRAAGLEGLRVCLDALRHSQTGVALGATMYALLRTLCHACIDGPRLSSGAPMATAWDVAQTPSQGARRRTQSGETRSTTTSARAARSMSNLESTSVYAAGYAGAAAGFREPEHPRGSQTHSPDSPGRQSQDQAEGQDPCGLGSSMFQLTRMLWWKEMLNLVGLARRFPEDGGQGPIPAPRHHAAPNPAQPRHTPPVVPSPSTPFAPPAFAPGPAPAASQDHQAPTAQVSRVSAPPWPEAQQLMRLPTSSLPSPDETMSSVDTLGSADALSHFEFLNHTSLQSALLGFRVDPYLPRARPSEDISFEELLDPKFPFVGQPDDSFSSVFQSTS